MNFLFAFIGEKINKRLKRSIRFVSLSQREIVWRQHTTFLNRDRDDPKRYAVTKKRRTDIIWNIRLRYPHARIWLNHDFNCKKLQCNWMNLGYCCIDRLHGHVLSLAILVVAPDEVLDENRNDFLIWRQSGYLSRSNFRNSEWYSHWRYEVVLNKLKLIRT